LKLPAGFFGSGFLKLSIESEEEEKVGGSIESCKSFPSPLKMSKTHSEVSDDFEFIETPAAPTPTPPVEDCGVRTTSVRQLPSMIWDVLE
jgi:hypothetical protein